MRAAAIELTAYLALHPAGASRDELLEAMWPGDDPAKSRNRLYQATRDARRLLGEDAITTANDRYILDRVCVAIDLADLDSLLHQLASGQVSADRRELLERAAGLFADQPLAGSDYRWAESEMRRLRTIQVDLFAQLSVLLLAEDDAQSALTNAERGIAVDPLNEELWRVALQAEARLGLRAAVDDRYQRLRRMLDERLGLEPAQATRRLYRQLLGQA